jgi:hypothetical protein
MTRRKIKHAQFDYYVPSVRANVKTGKEQERLARRIALGGTWVDIPRDEDVARGEKVGAFFTPEELDPSVATGDEELSDDDIESEEDIDKDELVRWIREDKPTAPQVVARAESPAMAQALIEAEEEASGGDPRSSVITPLEKIASS